MDAHRAEAANTRRAAGTGRVVVSADRCRFRRTAEDRTGRVMPRQHSDLAHAAGEATMTARKLVRVTLTIVVLAVAFMPSPAIAQAVLNATIAGVARDSSGSVLPGVTVEVASPALIEKVRTAVTDG